MKRPLFVDLRKDVAFHISRYHFHDELEIVLVLSDGGYLFLDNNTYALRRGVLMVINDTALHRSVNFDNVVYERYVAHFMPEYVRMLSTSGTDLMNCFNSDIHCVQLSDQELEKFIALFEECRQPWKGYGDDLRQQIAFTHILLKINEIIDKPEKVVSATSSGFINISQILNYINDNLSDSITLDSLADHFFTSKYYLCNLFKKATGFSIMEYVINLRVLKSKSLLRNGYSVLDSGKKSGFNNNSHFIRTFKKLVGVSPGIYSKNYKFTSALYTHDIYESPQTNSSSFR